MSLRNHGASPNTDVPMTIENLAADVAATLPAATLAGDAPVHVVGHSLGGKVAMALALAHPQSVKRLVVADISPVVYDKANSQWQEVVDICAAVDEMDLAAIHTRSHGFQLLTERGIVRVLKNPFIAPPLNLHLFSVLCTAR
jgi:pimeloyl-ACP methyl ester carboxylesterase